MIRYLLIAVLCVGSLYSSDNIQQMVESGQLEQALKLLQAMYKKQLTAAEKCILEINISSVYILEGKNQEAVSLLRRQHLGDQPPPHIASKYYYNLAMGLYKQGKQIQDTLKEEDETFLVKCDQMIADYQESLKALGEALKWNKELPLVLTQLQESLKVALAQGRERRELFWVMHIGIGELLALLKSELVTTIDTLERMNGGELQSDYVRNQAVLDLDILPLWDRGKKLVDETGDGKNYQEAYNAYLMSIDFQKEGDGQKSIHWKKEALNRIQDLQEMHKQDTELEKDTFQDKPNKESQDDKEGTSEVLELYQQMENEDRTNEEEKQGAVRKGLRPW